MVEVRVPATSANMGPGFDTMGLALNIYNKITIDESESGLEIINYNAYEYIPTNESNLIYKSVIRVFDEVGYIKRGLKISQKSNIPMTRGLGSSSACIVGGLLAGNVISGRKLSYDKILEMAVEMEGHPDNVVPAIYGGFCISAQDNKKIYHRSFKLSPKLEYVALIPNFYVPTKKSRGILPEYIFLKDAAFNISRATWLTACLISGNFNDLKIGTQDKIHQPYREDYVPDMRIIMEAAYKYGAKAAFLSGSGPTILSVIEGNTQEFSENISLFFKKNRLSWKCHLAQIDNVGAVVKSDNM